MPEGNVVDPQAFDPLKEGPWAPAIFRPDRPPANLSEVDSNKGYGHDYKKQRREAVEDSRDLQAHGEPLVVRHLEQRQQDVAADFGSAGRSGYPESISTTGNFNIEAAFDLPQVFIELSAEISKADVIGGLEDYVPRNLDSIQDLYSKPLRNKHPVRMTGASPFAAIRLARYLSRQ